MIPIIKIAFLIASLAQQTEGLDKGVYKITGPFHYGYVNDSTQYLIMEFDNVFKYDGDYLTTRYLYIYKYNPPKWYRKDGLYKFKAKWVGDTLKYLAPFEEWKTMGVFQDNQFKRYHLDKDSLHEYTFKKMNPDSLSNYDRPILNKRSLFPYYLTKKR